MAASKIETQISKPPRQKEIVADLKTRKTHRERRFHRLFRNVPTTEILLNRFSCAFVSDIGLLLQGHMYVSNDWICFHSNIFGIEKIIEIPVHSIAAVCKARTAKIIPNAVCIKTKGGKQYFFGSLLSRDTTHHLLNTVLNRFQEIQINDPASVVDEPDIVNNNTNDDLINNNNNSNTDNSKNNSYNSSGGNFENGGASSSRGQAQPNSIDSVTDVLLENSLQSSSSGDTSDDDIFENDDNRTKNAKNRSPTKVKIPVVKRNDFLTCLKHGYELTLVSFINWFSDLPKLLMLLIACIVLLALLFLLATALTLRLIYMQNPQISLSDLILSDTSGKKFDIDPTFFDKLNSMVENSVRLVDDVNLTNICQKTFNIVERRIS